MSLAIRTCFFRQVIRVGMVEGGEGGDCPTWQVYVDERNK